MFSLYMYAFIYVVCSFAVYKMLFRVNNFKILFIEFFDKLRVVLTFYTYFSIIAGLNIDLYIVLE